MIALVQTSSTGDTSGSSSKLASRNGANHQEVDARKAGTRFGLRLTMDRLKRMYGLKECSVVMERID